jgi:hypothetical protein
MKSFGFTGDTLQKALRYEKKLGDNVRDFFPKPLTEVALRVKPLLQTSRNLQTKNDLLLEELLPLFQQEKLYLKSFVPLRKSLSLMLHAKYKESQIDQLDTEILKETLIPILRSALNADCTEIAHFMLNLLLAHHDTLMQDVAFREALQKIFSLPIRNGDLQSVELFLACGASPHSMRQQNNSIATIPAPLGIACSCACSPKLDNLCGWHEENEEKIVLKREIIKTLLRHGANPHHGAPYSAVRDAAFFGFKEILDIFIQENIAIDHPGNRQSGEDLILQTLERVSELSWRLNALHSTGQLLEDTLRGLTSRSFSEIREKRHKQIKSCESAIDQCFDTLFFLLEQGIDPQSAIHSLAAMGPVSNPKHIAFLEALLERGVPVNDLMMGVAPLHKAAARGSTEIVKKLLEYGADPKILDRQVNKTAAQLARERGHRALANLIDSYPVQSR